MRFHLGPERLKNERIIEKRGINRRGIADYLKKGLIVQLLGEQEGVKVLIRIYDPEFLGPFIGTINNGEEVFPR